MSDDSIEPRFVTIVSARYGGGAYKPGAEPTPNAAYEDLLRVIQEPNLDPFTREYDWAAFTAERDRGDRARHARTKSPKPSRPRRDSAGIPQEIRSKSKKANIGRQSDSAFA